MGHAGIVAKYELI